MGAQFSNQDFAAEFCGADQSHDSDKIFWKTFKFLNGLVINCLIQGRVGLSGNTSLEYTLTGSAFSAIKTARKCWHGRWDDVKWSQEIEQGNGRYGSRFRRLGWGQSPHICNDTPVDYTRQITEKNAPIHTRQPDWADLATALRQPDSICDYVLSIWLTPQKCFTLVVRQC